MAFNLSKIFAHTDRDPLIRELTLDSRNVRPGDLFLAVPGIKVMVARTSPTRSSAAQQRWPTKSKVQRFCRSPTCR